MPGYLTVRPSPVLLAAAFSLTACLWLCSIAGTTVDSPTGKTVEELIRDLGSDQFAVREEAERQLQDREEAASALRQALRSPDAEVARRAARVLDALAKRASRRAADELAALAKAGALDQAVERLVAREKWDDEDACWQALAEAAHRLAGLGERAWGKGAIFMPEKVRSSEIFSGDFSKYLKAMRPRRIAARQALVPKSEYFVVVRGEEVSAPDGFMKSFIAASARLRTAAFGHCVVLAGGSVEAEGAADSVIVCDGDFTARGGISRSVVVARGAVTFDATRDSVIVTVGPSGIPKKVDVSRSVIRENEPTPLGFVKFFDPADAGITVEAAEGGVRVKEVAVGKPFARAGLRAGDLITGVDDAVVVSPESFRRLLRRKLAEGKETLFKVRRAHQAVAITVPLGN